MHTRYVSMSEHGLSRSTIVAVWRGLLTAFLFPTSFLAPRLRWWVEEEEMQTGERGSAGGSRGGAGGDGGGGGGRGGRGGRTDGRTDGREAPH